MAIYLMVKPVTVRYCSLQYVKPDHLLRVSASSYRNSLVISASLNKVTAYFRCQVGKSQLVTHRRKEGIDFTPNELG